MTKKEERRLVRELERHRGDVSTWSNTPTPVTIASAVRHDHRPSCEHDLGFCAPCDAVFCRRCDAEWKRPKALEAYVPSVFSGGYSPSAVGITWNTDAGDVAPRFTVTCTGEHSL